MFVGKQCFTTLCNIVGPRMRNSSQRSINNAVAMLLLVLRFGVTQQFLAILFRTSQQVVSEAISTVSNHLMELFVPYHLGFSHMTREEAMLHSTAFVREMLPNNSGPIVLIDGRNYLFII